MTRVLAAAVVLWGLAALAGAEGTAAPTTQSAPTVEVVFVLDTTSSMTGLIDGAKAKIWSIANKVLAGKPRPVVRMGLVAYRDKGDEYVTKVFDLTDNIDQVYNDLKDFKAQGGGDTPEHVNKALFDAVNKITWSADKKTLKIIYLVGDSPPHNEYTDAPKYDELAKAAIEKGIYVNTILCGSNKDTAAVWQEIARRAEGEFLAIEQNGGMAAVTTPMDAELATLNGKLVKTVVVYGDKAQQAAANKLNASAGSMPEARPEAVAERAAYSAKSGHAGSQDLVEGVASGKVKLDDVAKDDLPPEMQKMSKDEQTKFIADRQKEQAEVRQQIVDLTAKRDAYIKKEITSKAASQPAFDAKVVETLRQQAKNKDIQYE